jgi:hypothetical protein
MEAAILRTTLVSASIAVAACGETSSTSPAGSPGGSQSLEEYSKLIDRARAYITEWNRDDPLCDEIELPNLDNIQRGRVVFIATGGGKVEPPIPAIIAKISGNCIVRSQRVREPITKFWLMMAEDKAFNRYTCVKIGGADLIRGFAERNCEFVPNPGQVGLIGNPVQGDKPNAPPVLPNASAIAGAFSCKDLNSRAFFEDGTYTETFSTNGRRVSLKFGTYSINGNSLVITYLGTTNDSTVGPADLDDPRVWEHEIAEMTQSGFKVRPVSFAYQGKKDLLSGMVPTDCKRRSDLLGAMRQERDAINAAYFKTVVR